MNPVTVPVRPSLLDGTIKFVELSSAFCKRAGDEIEARRAAEKAASDLRPGLLDHMLKTATVTPTQKDTADSMLSTHAGTMQLLKAAIDKIVELKTASGQIKKAGELGGPAGPDVNGTDKTAADEIAAIPVGARTSFVRESDLPLLRLIGQGNA